MTLLKAGGFSSNWPLARGKFASVWLCHPKYQCIIQTKYPRAVSWIIRSTVEYVDLPMLKKYNYDVRTAFYTPLVCLSCNWVAASHMKIVPAWPPVACEFPPILFMLHASGGHAGTICLRLAWPVGYNLYATGSHSGTIYIRLVPSRMQTLHALAASCMQSRQFFASTLQEQL